MSQNQNRQEEVRSLFIILFIVFCSSISHAGEIERLGSMNPMEDRKAFLKQAVKAYKEAKSGRSTYKGSPEYLQFLEHKRREEIEQSSVCVGCPNLLLLTEQVNKILQEQKKTLPKNTPASVFNEIDSLEGMFYFVQNENKEGNLEGSEAGCKRYDYGFQGIFAKEKDLNLNNHVMLFTEEVNFKSITQIHLTKLGEKKTYFLKGKAPNDDVVVKVVTNGRGPATVTYYRHKEIIIRKKALTKKEQFDQKAFPTKTFKSSGGEKKNGAEEKTKAPEDELKFDYGVETEEDSFMPKKVTLLGLSGVSHFESTTLRAGTEISSDQQMAEVELSSKDRKDFLKLDMDATSKVRLQSRSDFESFAVSSQLVHKDGKGTASMQLRDDKDKEVLDLSVDAEGLAKIGIPLQFNVYDTGLLVDGRVVAGQDGQYGGTWVISDRATKKQYVDVGMRGNKDGAGVSIGHSRKPFKNDSKISVKVTHDEFNNHKSTAGWVQFSLDF
ncbi:MAG: hypothetical protein ACJAT2_003224 [Bacteriovoracaceae bacterium]